MKDFERALTRVTQSGAPRSRGRAPVELHVRPSLERGHQFENLRVSSPRDAHELEADRMSDQVMRSSSGGPVQPAALREEHGGPSSGEPLSSAVRSHMEPRFGMDLGAVRTHTDSVAARACELLNAQAFTVRRHIYFSRSARPGNDALTAHELAHVAQQANAPTSAPMIHRKLELRPPGKGEASAFDRAQELVDRLNTVSPAIQYTLNGQVLDYEVKDAAALTHFDSTMKGFIDRGEVVPMRLITHRGYVGGGPLFADSFILAYVDLDDLLADDIYSFQSDLLHFLTERFVVKDYERRIGTDMSASFPRAHRAGKDAEAAQLQALFNDPSVVFVYEELKANSTWVNAFKSRDHGYWVFQVVRNTRREIAGGEMWVQKKDGKRVSMDDFRKERAAATAAP